VFSLGPLLLIVTSAAGLFFGAETVRGSLTGQFRSLLGRRQGRRGHAGRSKFPARRPPSGVLGSLLLLVAALGVVVQLNDGRSNGLLKCGSA
jgi:hypothetical protein